MARLLSLQARAKRRLIAGLDLLVFVLLLCYVWFAIRGQRIPTFLRKAGGVASVLDLCPPGTVIYSAEELTGQQWSVVKAIPLPAPGQAPVAYLERSAEKQSPILGTIPAPLNNRCAVKRLLAERDAQQNYFDLRAALDLLGQHKPDVWLPATSLVGFNALLSDDAWKELIAENMCILK